MAIFVEVLDELRITYHEWVIECWVHPPYWWESIPRWKGRTFWPSLSTCQTWVHRSIRIGNGAKLMFCYRGKSWVPHKGERGPKRRKELQWFSDCLGSGNLVLAREKKIVEGNTSSAEWYMISRETERLVAGFQQAGIRSRESNKTIRYKAMFARL